jgi:hypothetical protein
MTRIGHLLAINNIVLNEWGNHDKPVNKPHRHYNTSNNRDNWDSDQAAQREKAEKRKSLAFILATGTAIAAPVLGSMFLKCENIDS